MEILTVDDFDELDFIDPISLLSAIKSLSSKEIEAEPQLSKFLSVEDLKKIYGLSPDYIRASLLSGTVKPANIELYFSKEDAERLAAEYQKENPVISLFEAELEKMAINYSYKPLLLLALINSDFCCASLDEITDYFFAFYANRASAGMKVEKEDSAFIQHNKNRIIAKRTILRYPVSVLAKKGFVIYEKGHDSVRLNDALKPYVLDNRATIKKACEALLEKYYSAI